VSAKEALQVAFLVQMALRTLSLFNELEFEQTCAANMEFWRTDFFFYLFLMS
jgi:hypothetical protein